MMSIWSRLKDWLGIGIVRVELHNGECMEFRQRDAYLYHQSRHVDDINAEVSTIDLTLKVPTERIHILPKPLSECMRGER